MRQGLTKSCISPIGSTEAERAASGVGKLKTPFRLTMKEDRESDLNFLQQVFTNCVHGYDRARNVHTNGVTRTLKFVHGTDSSV